MGVIIGTEVKLVPAVSTCFTKSGRFGDCNILVLDAGGCRSDVVWLYSVGLWQRASGSAPEGCLRSHGRGHT